MQTGGRVREGEGGGISPLRPRGVTEAGALGRAEWRSDRDVRNFGHRNSY